jgi:hypothetical protein
MESLSEETVRFQLEYFQARFNSTFRTAVETMAKNVTSCEPPEEASSKKPCRFYWKNPPPRKVLALKCTEEELSNSMGGVQIKYRRKSFQAVPMVYKRDGYDGLACLPDATLHCIWSFLGTMREASNLASTCTTLYRSFETDCSPTLHLEMAVWEFAANSTQWPTRFMSKTRSLLVNHWGMNNRVPGAVGELVIDPSTLPNLEQLEVRCNQYGFAIHSPTSLFLLTLKHLSLEIAQDRFDHIIGTSLPNLEKMSLNLSHYYTGDFDAMGRRVAPTPCLIDGRFFEKLGELVLDGGMADFNIVGKSFPLLKTLWIGQCSSSSVFDLSCMRLDSVTVCCQSMRVLFQLPSVDEARSNAAHIQQLTVTGQVTSEWFDEHWLPGVSIGDATFLGYFPLDRLDTLANLNPARVHLIIEMRGFWGLIDTMFSSAKTRVLPWDLVDIDVDLTYAIPADYERAKTQELFVTNTNFLASMPKKITVRASEHGIDPIDLMSYTKALKYSETHVDEIIALRLSLPDVIVKAYIGGFKLFE